MVDLTKIDAEELLIGRDWTLDLDDASITAAVPAAISGGAALTCEYLDTAGKVTRYWLRGGDVGRVYRITLSIETNEGEVLSDRISVVVQ